MALGTSVMRWARRTAIAAVLVLAALFGIYVLANLGDEALAPQAQALLQVQRASVADGENGFLTLVGLGAPAGASPAATARAWLDHLSAEHEASLRERREPAFRAAPALDTSAWAKLRCDAAKEACLPKWLAQRAEAEAVMTKLAAVRKHYDTALGQTKFEEAIWHSPSTPLPHYSGLAQVGEMALAQVAFLCADGQGEAGLKLLAAKLEFERRTLVSAHSLLLKMFMLAQLHKSVRVLDEVGRAYPALAQSQQSAIAQSLRPLTDDEADAAAVLTGELQFQLRAMNDMLTSPYALRVASYANPAVLTELPHRLQLAGLRINQTLNLQTALLLPEIAAAKGGARGFDQRHAAANATIAAIDLEPAWHWLRNPVGKMLVSIGRPGYGSYAARGYDMDGFVRLAALAALARSEKIKPEDMEKWLASTAPHFRNPYNQEPMRWDAGRKTLVFTGKARAPYLPGSKNEFVIPL